MRDTQGNEDVWGSAVTAPSIPNNGSYMPAEKEPLSVSVRHVEVKLSLCLGSNPGHQSRSAVSYVCLTQNVSTVSMLSVACSLVAPGTRGGQFCASSYGCIVLSPCAVSGGRKSHHLIPTH
jgi:hypothetical protein